MTLPRVPCGFGADCRRNAWFVITATWPTGAPLEIAVCNWHFQALYKELSLTLRDEHYPEMDSGKHWSDDEELT